MYRIQKVLILKKELNEKINNNEYDYDNRQ